MNLPTINLIASLDPSIKAFIFLASILGPLCITGLIFLLKQIQKEDPDRIRWN